MPISPLAGKPAPKELLVDPSQLEHEYYERRPDLENPNEMVSFGTSGHRGSPLTRIIYRIPHSGHYSGDL